MALPQNKNILTPDIIAKEGAMVLDTSVVLAQKGDWKYSKEFGKAAEKIGDSIRIKKPVISSTVTNDPNWVDNRPYQGSLTLEIDQSFLTPLSFSQNDLSLRINDFSGDFIRDNVDILASQIDQYFYKKVMESCHWTVGQYSTAISPDTIRAAQEVLAISHMPKSNVFGILTPKHTRNLATGMQSFFNATPELAEIYRNNSIGRFAGVDFAESTNSPVHTDGDAWTAAGTGYMNFASSTVLTSGWAETSTLSVSGFTAAKTLKKGDVFTLSGTAGKIYNYSPLLKGKTAYPQQFVVVEDVDTTVTASQSVKVSPALVIGGDYQCVASAAGNFNLVPHTDSGDGSGQEGLIFHKSAIALASPKLVIPDGLDEKSAMVCGDAAKINLRYTRDWDPKTTTFITRLDAIVGCKVIRPEWVCRIR